jgi:HD-GYP domain-containing protein (c-di-GMP phosphodiesterase class II)
VIKKIAISQLVPGMYVHKLAGSWLDHPFWKRAFLLADMAQLELIRRSKVFELWIDTSRGRDVAMQPEDACDEALLATTLDPDRGQEPDLQACSLREELARAERIVAQGRGAMEVMFQDVRLGKAIDAEHCLPLVNEITGSVKRNRGAMVSLARLKTSDDYTYMHSVAVCALMVALARQLDLSEALTREAGMAGLMHDLGKAMMPIEVLNKRGALTESEFAIIKGHPEAGHRMLMESRAVDPTTMDVALHHHEKVNGTGYPHGLRGDAISLPARMGAVCDVYDAITSNRPYKLGWDPARSVHSMAQWSREGHFDEAVFQAFVKSIGIYPIGSLVRLESGRLGVIVDQSPRSLLTPMVKAILVVATRKACAPELVDLSAPGCGDRIVSREAPAAWGLTGLDDHWRYPAD